MIKNKLLMLIVFSSLFSASVSAMGSDEENNPSRNRSTVQQRPNQNKSGNPGIYYSSEDEKKWPDGTYNRSKVVVNFECPSDWICNFIKWLFCFDKV